MAGNAVKLGFPQVRAGQGERIAPEPAEFYLDGILRWVGALVYQSCDEAKQLYAYNFVADAADLASRLEGLNLPALALGTVALALSPTAADYALPSLRNSQFYDPEKVPYSGVVNYYQSGAYRLTVGGKRAPVVPFPRLVPLLHRVLGCFGYTVSGPWLDLPEVQKLIVYSDRAAEDAAGNVPASFDLNRHVPDLGVGDFLIALQQFFGLGYAFHPVRRELRITALRDVATDPSYVVRLGGPAKVTAVTSDGFSLEMGLEEDELNKTLDTGWAKLVIGNGKQKITTVAGTLHVVREPNVATTVTSNNVTTPGTAWLVPAVEAKGASLAFEAGDDSRCGLRLLYDRGLQADAAGALYPLATWDRVNYAGTVVGQSTLHWAGEFGLYATWHAAWLAFLDRAATRQSTMQFRVADLLALDPARKELVNYQKYFWEKVSLSLSTTGKALEQAQFTYRYTLL